MYSHSYKIMASLKDLVIPAVEKCHTVVGFTKFEGEPCVKIKSWKDGFWAKPRPLTKFIEEYTLDVIHFIDDEPSGETNAEVMADMIGKKFLYIIDNYGTKPAHDGNYGGEELDAAGVAALLD
jgi:hypothetical protein